MKKRPPGWLVVWQGGPRDACTMYYTDEPPDEVLGPGYAWHYTVGIATENLTRVAVARWQRA